MEVDGEKGLMRTIVWQELPAHRQTALSQTVVQREGEVSYLYIELSTRDDSKIQLHTHVSCVRLHGHVRIIVPETILSTPAADGAGARGTEYRHSCRLRCPCLV